MSGEKMSASFVIFGATGDLTHRKLMTAFYSMIRDGLLSDDFCIVAIGRRKLSTETYREQVCASLGKFLKSPVDTKIWQRLERMIFYYEFDFTQSDGYRDLNSYLAKRDKESNTKENRVFYLAVAPSFFETIIHGIERGELASSCRGFCRCVIEKPFGKDLETAKKLNDTILRVFPEKSIYRIDHYLGKDMIQNIMILRFSNLIFESLWNNRYIDNVQISLTEKLGVETRGDYYEDSGAMRDMVQNHILQIVSLVAMEPPVNLKMDSIRNEKQKVLEALEKIDETFLENNVVFGQYAEGFIDGKKVQGYRSEEKVDAKSETETFVALKLQIENFRWAGTPFYIRTGKRLKEASGEIIIQFKELPHSLYNAEKNLAKPNLLILRIQPKVGLYFQFNTKDYASHSGIIPITMDTGASDAAQGNTPEAYERLLYDILRGDGSLFSRWDELEAAWLFADKLIEYREQKKTDFPNYAAGTMGPKRAFDLIEKDGRSWVDMH
ncbi:MAG TPA: glucose-6-phosphate dehydrogenase [Treponemataceae bacterium]|jgi:glucose-6-phosphate 1-dehydrogenase|nr:glucose-6-phosphate dehydrogenase [Spirochaetota bacterium]NMA56058.1 glucose-6-phosphate dehydrogenase [Treponema sp.]HOF12477.1 glucose-6-phosphate dehydrogenase [Treponemataceae bacterium]HOQ92684.1 glucose-6-phosphate dehydrogenase [Treponemataceae bacterium]HPM06201.1 glucose-6-phosphate dehydrogenase [Treponemataceae bacterium]